MNKTACLAVLFVLFISAPPAFVQAEERVFNPDITKLMFTTDLQMIQAGATSSPMIIEAQNSDGVHATVGDTAHLVLYSDSPTGEFASAVFSSGNCNSDWGDPKSMWISYNSYRKSFCYRDTTVGSSTLTISTLESTGWTPAMQIIQIAAPMLPDDATDVATTSDEGTFVDPGATTIPLVVAADIDGSLVAVISSATEASTTADGIAVTFAIPASMTITGSSTWDGILNLPHAVAVYTAPVPSDGFTATVVSAIEIGSDHTALVLDKGIRITFANQATKRVGWSQGGTFTPITATCSADNQVVGDALPAAGDCTIDSGADLVVWTKHLTTFVAYTETAVPVPSSPATSGTRHSSSIPVTVDVAITTVNEMTPTDIETAVETQDQAQITKNIPVLITPRASSEPIKIATAFVEPTTSEREDEVPPQVAAVFSSSNSIQNSTVTSLVTIFLLAIIGGGVWFWRRERSDL